MATQMFASELAALSNEARRKHTDVREASDRALAAINNKGPDVTQDTLLAPILLGCQTKQPKIIACAIACLQRLVGIRGAVAAILQTLRSVLSQGVEIQLKILQTLVALLTNCPGIHGAVLADTLLLCFRLQESKIGVVSSTAAATLRQLIMTLFEGVSAETGAKGHPAASDATAVFSDLCLLVSASMGERSAGSPSFLTLSHLPTTFGLELIESVLSDFSPLFLQHPPLLERLKTLLSPLLLRALSPAVGSSHRVPPFSTTLRLLRVVFLLLKQFHAQLEAETDVFIRLLVKLVDEDAGWPRVLALEIFRGLCSDFDLMLHAWIRYDAVEGTDPVFTAVLGALSKLATEKPQLLGVAPAPVAKETGIVGLVPGGVAGDAVNGLVEMAAQAASSVGGISGLTAIAGLSYETASMKVQWCVRALRFSDARSIDQLDKTEAPMIPETYPFLLALQCLASVANGFHTFVWPFYSHRITDNGPAPSALSLEPPFDGDLAVLAPVKAMVDAAWPALLVALAFYMSTNLDDALFGETLGATRAFAVACGAISLVTPRDAFLTSLCRLAVPPALLAEAEGAGLSTRHAAALRAVISLSIELAGSLGSTWETVFETLQSAELASQAAAVQKMRRIGSTSGGSPEAEDVTPDIARLFEASTRLDDKALDGFVNALCHINAGLLGMTDESRQIERQMDAMSPGPARTGSGVLLSRATRPGETALFGITRLGDVAMLNLSRLAQPEPITAYASVVNHLLAVQHLSIAPAPFRLQAAEVFDRFLEATIAAPAPVQLRALQALDRQAQDVQTGATGSTDLEIRRMALDALYRLLETNGHALVCGWQPVFGIITAAVAPSVPSATAERPALRSRGSSIRDVAPVAPSVRATTLTRVAFPSLQLICTDFLGTLSVDELRLCISALSSFGRQSDDLNIALTVSDHLQTRRSADATQATAFSDLWMFLLHQLLSFVSDSRSDVRDGAATTVFRSLELYGGSLDAKGWQACISSVIFPLLQAVEKSPSSPETQKAWDDTKTLVINSAGKVFADFLVAHISRTQDFEATWSKLSAYLCRSFETDAAAVATAAMRALLKVVHAVDGSSSWAATSMERIWTDWTGTADQVLQGSTGRAQASIEAFIRVAGPLASWSGVSASAERCDRLLVILRGLVAYQHSADYPSDIDSLTPAQKAVVEVIDALAAHARQSSPAILAQWSVLSRLAFETSAQSLSASTRARRPTFIALNKATLPRAAKLYGQSSSEAAAYESGAVVELLRALAAPIALRYSCPPSCKFGDDPPLWRTATFLLFSVLKTAMSKLDALTNELSDQAHNSVWQALVDTVAASMLADNREAPIVEDGKIDEDELLDLGLISLLEVGLLPRLQHPRVPDDVVRSFARAAQRASRLYDLDVPTVSLPLTPPTTPGREARFIDDFEAQCTTSLKGTTARVIGLPRERVAYWSLDLLVLLCNPSTEAGARVARLALPFLLSRCGAAVQTYLADQALMGRLPFPRIREEELTVILRRLLAIRIAPGTFPTTNDSSPFASALQSHPLAHLFRFMPQLVALAGLSKPTLPLPVQYRGAFAGSLPAGIAPGRISKDEVLPRPIETAATVPQLSRAVLAALSTVLSV